MDCAECFPPGEYIKDEIEERGWLKEDFARMAELSIEETDALFCGKKRILLGLAQKLQRIFGCSAITFLNLQREYDKCLAKRNTAP